MKPLLKRRICNVFALLVWMVLACLPQPIAASTMELPQELYTLLDICGVEHDSTLPSIVQATQSAWLRKQGQERWQLEEKDFGAENNKKIRRLIERMGFIHEKSPECTHYTYCLILGSTLPSFQKRLNYVRTLWERGVRFEQIMILTGDRDLDPVADHISQEHNCRNETQGSRFIYENTQLPDDLRALPLFVIDSPKQPSPKGLTRPTTIDTIQDWLALRLPLGTCLLVSNQPQVLYQDSVVRCLLRYPFSTVGPATTAEKNSLAVLLDTVARWLYQQLEYRKTH